MTAGGLPPLDADADGTVVRAGRAVTRAEGLAGARVVELHTVEELTDAATLWQQVWGRDSAPPVSPELLRALAHAGNYVAGAYSDSAMTGALLGFYGGHEGVDHVHSHMLGVAAGTRGRGVGHALKLHQRRWTLERGLPRIEWTYDPLVRTNAFFNLAKLGAEGSGYIVDFYGTMPDAINAGDQTDRVLITWELASRRATEAAGGLEQVAGTDVAASATVILDVGPDDAPVAGDGDGDILLARVPSDIVALRRRDPGLGRAWRLALRHALSGALERGLRIRWMTRDGWYVMERPALEP